MITVKNMILIDVGSIGMLLAGAFILTYILHSGPAPIFVLGGLCFVIIGIVTFTLKKGTPKEVKQYRQNNNLQ